jgi:hypothetical protein
MSKSTHFSGTTIRQRGGCGTIIDGSIINTRPIEDELHTRIAELEELVERLIELGDVINGDKDSVWTLQTVKERWTIEVAKWKERE